MKLGEVIAASADHFDVKEYGWYKYTNARGITLTDARGRSVKIKTGDVFGVKEATRKSNRVLALNLPNVVFKVELATSEKLVERSRGYRGKVKLPVVDTPVKKPGRVRINLAEVDDKTVHTRTKPEASKPVKPDVEAKKVQRNVERKITKPGAKQRIKIDMQIPEDDPDFVPHGYVRHKGRLITPDELELGRGGKDLPIPKSYTSLSSISMYYGAPHLTSDFKKLTLMFLSPHLNVAEDYAHGRKTFDGLKPMNEPIHPEVYKVSVNLRRIFDMRQNACVEDYQVIRDSNPELALPHVHSPDFIKSRSGLPGYTYVRTLRNALVDLGYDSMWVDEGPQGVTFAIFQPHALTHVEKIL